MQGTYEGLTPMMASTQGVTSRVPTTPEWGYHETCVVWVACAEERVGSIRRAWPVLHLYRCIVGSIVGSTRRAGALPCGRGSSSA